MAYYKIYHIDDQGQIFRPPVEHEFKGDEVAIAEALKYLDRHGVEVWEGSRYVATFRRHESSCRAKWASEPTDAERSFADRQASLSTPANASLKANYRR
jgi:hypothetical protein